MIIINTLMNMVYNRQPQIRKKCFDLEEKLSNMFLPPNIFPVPDGFDDAVPRFIMQSKNAHSNLAVSLVNAQLETTFDGDYLNNWEKCSQYIADRFAIIYETFEDIIATEVKYIGLITNILYTLEDGKSVNDVLLGAFNQKIQDSKPNDINFRISFITENKYFINISVMNGKSMNLPIGRGIELSDKDLGITIDINDRYPSNINPNYTSNKEMIQKTIDLTTETLTSTIDRFIKDGEFLL